MKRKKPANRNFLTELAIAKADFAIQRMADGGHNPPPQIDETQPLIKEAVRVANALLKLLLRQLACIEGRSNLQDIEDFLEVNGDKISPEDKKKLEAAGEALWESIQRNC